MTLHVFTQRSVKHHFPLAAVLVCIFIAPRMFAQHHLKVEQKIQTDTLAADAGSFDLHLLKKGNKNGYTVIMENGLCGMAEQWNKLDDSIAVHHTVVTYNRAFIGKSGKGNPERTATQVTAELKTALRNARISGPYILVGYSLGGHYVKAFARTNLEDVKGILLLDPLNSADFYRNYRNNFPQNFELDMSPLKSLTAKHPCYHEINAINESNYGYNSVPLHIPTYMLISSRAQDSATVLQSLKEYENGKSLDPAKLLEGNTESQKLWVQEHLKWASAFPNVYAEVTNECTHGMHHERPDIVWNAFLKLMARVNW